MDLGQLTLQKIKELPEYKYIFQRSKKRKMELILLLLESYPEKFTFVENRIKKAMNNHEASCKKTSGHENERIFSQLINGKVVNGKGKADVVTSNGVKCSLKQGKRYQLALYSINSPCFTSSRFCFLISQCQLAFPENIANYEKNKVRCKKKLQFYMKELRECLNDGNELRKFLYWILTNGERNFLLVLKQLNTYYVFDVDEVIKVLLPHIQVKNSKAIRKDQMNALKVVFKIEYDHKYVNVIENEIRNDSRSHYREFLSVCNADKLIWFLLENIHKTNIQEKYVLCGRAQL